MWSRLRTVLETCAGDMTPDNLVQKIVEMLLTGTLFQRLSPMSSRNYRGVRTWVGGELEELL